MARAFTPTVNAAVSRTTAVLAALAAFIAGTAGAVADINPPLAPMDAETIVNDAASPFRGMPAEMARQFCSIVVSSPGVMMASLDMQSLSSDVMGGRAGRASVTTTNASFRLVYDAPAAFQTVPSGSVPPTVFIGKLRGSGATNFLDHPAGSPVKLKGGVTDIDVSLTASAQGGTYPAGHYATEAVLRCE